MLQHQNTSCQNWWKSSTHDSTDTFKSNKLDITYISDKKRHMTIDRPDTIFSLGLRLTGNRRSGKRREGKG